MKKYLLTITACVMALIAMAQAPAFPGAEGVARLTTTGGRGGKVIHVTNLNDDGAGSLRQAVQRTSGARIVVFDVSGVIELQSQLKINNDNITIEGQTAPGDGICLKNYTFNISANNVIVRFIRCRMGDEHKTEDDAMNAYFKTGNEKSNIIIDHCSMSWSTDECGSFYGIKNFTLQWCVLSESLRNSVHDKGKHGFGGIWGGQNAAYHHNLLAHHDSRNPRFDHDYVNTLKGPIDYVNNVVYNWGGNSSYGGESANTTNTYKMYNMINNYYKPGPATNSGVRTRFVNPTTKCDNCINKMGVSTVVPGHFYITGNYMYGSSNVTSDNWLGVRPDDNTTAVKDAIKATTRFLPTGYDDNLITTHTAETAFDRVLAYAGASYKKDVIDQRIAQETSEGTYTYLGSNGSTGGFIDTQSDVKGWPSYIQGTKLADTDNDGMPDIWEQNNGLNPNDASDAITKTLDPMGYYTNIEVYCNALVEDLVKAQNAGASATINEYYPTVTKVSGIPYYDAEVMAEGGYPEEDIENTVIFSAYPTTAMSISAGTETEITTCATITGGKMYAINQQTEAKDMIKPQGGEYAFQFTNNNTFFKVILDTPLLVGDIISTRMQSRTDTDLGLFFSDSEIRPSATTTSIILTQASSQKWCNTPTYTIQTGDGICGQKTFYIFRATGKTTFFNNFVITRSGTTDISNIKADTDNLPTYNLQGQRVDNSYKGIVIRNGKKIMNK